MSFDFKLLSNNLLQELVEPMAGYGFKLKKAEWRFEAKSPFGMKRLSLGMIRHPGIDFDVYATVGIRFDAVEDLTNEFDSINKLKLDEKTKKLTCTIGDEFGNLSGVGQKRWTVAKEADVTPAVLGILQDFQSIGLPYLEKYSDPQRVLEAYVAGEKSFIRSDAALALACVAKDRERFEAFVIQGRKSAYVMNNYGLDRFNALAAKLDSMI